MNQTIRTNTDAISLNNEVTILSMNGKKVNKSTMKREYCYAKEKDSEKSG